MRFGQFNTYTAGLKLLISVLIALLPAAPVSIAGDGPDTSGGKIIDGVPFVKQKDEFCGPAAMASVLGYYGGDEGQEEIAEKVYTPKLKGALISDMENYARSRGYGTATINGSVETLASAIDDGTPAILLVDRGKWKVSSPHYYVVYGYDPEDKTFILHTGEEAGERIGYDRLDSEWERMNRLMLVITK